MKVSQSPQSRWRLLERGRGLRPGAAWRRPVAPVFVRHDARSRLAAELQRVGPSGAIRRCRRLRVVASSRAAARPHLSGRLMCSRLAPDVASVDQRGGIYLRHFDDDLPEPQVLATVGGNSGAGSHRKRTKRQRCDSACFQGRARRAETRRKWLRCTRNEGVPGSSPGVGFAQPDLRHFPLSAGSMDDSIFFDRQPREPSGLMR